MRLGVNEAPSHLGEQRLLWNLLRLALEDEEGVAWFRYPLYGLLQAVPAPEFVLLLRRYGLWLLTCSGIRPDGLGRLDWRLHAERAELWLAELQRRIESVPELLGLPMVTGHRLALPFVDRLSEGPQRGAEAALNDGLILSRERLTPNALRTMFEQYAAGAVLTDRQWELLQAVLNGRIVQRPQSTSRNPSRDVESKTLVEYRSLWLDASQERVAHEVPEGPQRIRGVAGSGKTSLLANRAAAIHAAHPEWDVVFLVREPHSRARIEALVATAFENLTGRAPDPARLRVWSAWGDADSEGLLRRAAAAFGKRQLGPADAQYRLGWREAKPRGLAWACEETERDLAEEEVTPFLDVLLVDEAQDMPAALFRLALRALRPPGRLYWAYDEFQGLQHTLVPRAVDLFGLDAAGRPRVDLAGHYPSGIPKTRLLSRSYRTPAAVLDIAQILGMGLLRRAGPLQSVSHRDEWINLGFRVEGDLTAAGVRARRTLAIERAPDALVHPADHLLAEDEALPEPPFTVIEVEEEQAAVAAIVAGVREDLEAGWAGEDLLVVAMSQSQPTPEKLGVALNHAGIRTEVVTDDGFDVESRQAGCVMVASVEAIRGHEAWKVYVSGLHRVTAESVLSVEDELLRRNQALLAMTRARLCCVAVGEKGPFMTEVLQALRADGRFRFSAFEPSELYRDISSWVLGGVGAAGRVIELN